MTMHLAQGLTTTKTTKPRASKLTKAKRKEIGDQLCEYNKELKRQGRHNERLTFDEYLDYLHGKPKAKNPKLKHESRRLHIEEKRRIFQASAKTLVLHSSKILRNIQVR